MQHDQPSHSLSAESQWELAFVYAFSCVFSELKDKNIYAFPAMQPEELEEALTLENSQLVDDLLCSFLNNALNRKKPLAVQQCSKELTKMINASIKSGDLSWKTNPLYIKSFGELEPNEKLTILRVLIEWQLQECYAIREAIEMPESKGQVITSRPVGMDNEKRYYWHFGDSPWLWREKSKLKTGCRWETVCRTLDELEQFAESLSNKKPEQSLALYITETIIPRVQNAIRRRERQELARQRQIMAEDLITERRLRPRRSARPTRYTFGDDYVDEYIDQESDKDGPDTYESSSSEPEESQSQSRVTPMRSSTRLALRSSTTPMYINGT
ncbi:hypothetical protein K492DRAFT_237803 [Lichtheimia hyalospora FSU 10163]|nr:hypothetical protein K492DRAFT_237803 [Lichtheimia hyalospora FSU 10163]